MEIRPIGWFRSPFPEKFGIPRQAGVVPSLEGRIELATPYDDPQSLRGLEGFDYIWLIWGFSANPPADDGPFKATVRPPRLGGNERIGVFASRSPFRPNGLGLSAVRILQVGPGPVIHVEGADLMDGTPVYDIKPYVTYADSHPEARSGFVDENGWKPLEVDFPNELQDGLAPSMVQTLRDILEQDPRPRAAGDPAREFGFSFGGHRIRFRVEGDVLHVTSVEEAQEKA